MKKNFFSYFFLSVFVIFFFSITYLSLDSDFRRKVLSFSVGIINSYYEISIKQNLNTSVPDINRAIKKLDEQIKISDYLTSNSKNSFLDNVYLNAQRIEESISINSEKSYGYFSEIIKKLIRKDPNLYLAIVWEAKLMKMNNLESEKIINKINQAINLSPANIEAYKFALDYTFIENKKNLFKKYCSMYHTSMLGGANMKNQTSYLQSNSLSGFAMQILSKTDKEEFYPKEGISLNNFRDYIFTLSEPKNLSGLNLFVNFFPGTTMSFTRLEFTDLENKRVVLPINEIYMNSKNSFFEKNEKHTKLITTSQKRDKIQLKFDKVYKNVTKIIINLNFSKFDLTNQTNC